MVVQAQGHQSKGAADFASGAQARQERPYGCNLDTAIRSDRNNRQTCWHQPGLSTHSGHDVVEIRTERADFEMATFASRTTRADKDSCSFRNKSE